MKATLYLDKLRREQACEIEVPVGVTIHEWVAQEAPAYQELPRQPVSIWRNGEQVAAADWPRTRIADGDLIEVIAEPAGKGLGSFIDTIFPGLGSAFNYAMSALIPSIPQPSSANRPQGSSIYDANTQGNQPRLGGVIPEIAGHHRYYPDLINTGRRYYSGNAQYLDLLVCVGRGHYELPESQVYIGNGSLLRFSGDVVWSIFEPGQVVTGHPAWRNWYTSPEVDRFEIEGAEVTSISGLEGERSLVVGHDTGGSYLIVRDATQAVDPGWAIGCRISVSGTSATSQLFEGVVSVVDGGTVSGIEQPDIIQGAYNWSGLTVGQSIQLVQGGPLDGTYKVGAVSGRDLTLTTTDGVAITGLTPATGVLLRIVTTDSADGLYDVVNRDLDVTYVTRVGAPGWPGFGADVAYAHAALAIVLGARPANQFGPYLATPPGQKTSRIELDFTRRGGWGTYASDGSLTDLVVNIEIHWRDAVAAGGWTVVAHSFTGRSFDELGETLAIDLPAAIEPEIKIIRTTGKFGSSRYIDKIEWVGLKALLQAPTSYATETVLALSIKGSNTLSGLAERRLAVQPTRRLQVLLAEGVWSEALVATRDISAFFRYALLDAGYIDAEIDQAELYRLHQIWTARGDTFDGVLDSSDTLYQALNKILLPGFAEATQEDGLWRVVRDDARTLDDVEQQFGPHVQLLDTFEVTDLMLEPNEADGVDVEYMDPVSWKPATVRCRLDGDAGAKPLQIKAIGVTSRLRAWRIGMRERRKQLYRKRTLRWKTAAAGLNASYLSLVSCADEEPGYSQSGEVVGWDAATLTLQLSCPLVAVSGTSYVMALRRPDGTQYGPVAITPVGVPVAAQHFLGDSEDATPGYLQVQLGSAPDFDVRPLGEDAGDPTYYLAGESTTWCYLGLIKSARPDGSGHVDIEALAYDGRVFADDDEDLPEGI